jgi:hypothetical protein
VEEDAEAAVVMFSAAINGKIAERLMSTENNYKNNVVKSNKYSCVFVKRLMIGVIWKERMW